MIKNREIAFIVDLKPCPFCGATAILFVDNGVRVRCSNDDCDASSKCLIDSDRAYGNATKSVVKAWNMRVDGGGDNAGD